MIMILTRGIVFILLVQLILYMGSDAPTSDGGVFGVLISSVPTLAAWFCWFTPCKCWRSRDRYVRVAADPDSDDEVLAEILFRVIETIPDSAASPPRSRRKHRGVRSDDSLWDKPVEDFFSSESESDDDMENYIPLFPMKISRLGDGDLYFRLNPDVDVGLDLWRDVNLLCQSLHSDDVEDFWRTQDDWIVSSWKLYPKNSVHGSPASTNLLAGWLLLLNVFLTVKLAYGVSYAVVLLLLLCTKPRWYSFSIFPVGMKKWLGTRSKRLLAEHQQKGEHETAAISESAGQSVFNWSHQLKYATSM
ncbi:hypothetical protein Tco_1052268 [Tanacetum coccineum]